MAKKEKIVKDTAERWLLTYADLMNLLLIFFIILYAMSKVDQNKFDALSTALNQAFNPLQGSGVMPYPDKNSLIDRIKNTGEIENEPGKGKEGESEGTGAESKVMEILKEKVEELVKEMGLQGIVTVTQQERGVQISIPSNVLFKPGSDEIEGYAAGEIENIGKILNSISKNQIKIEGHTDADPINTPRFASNWDLSAARAVRVLRFLIEKNNIDGHRISATGYGEMWPITENNSEENKARNRRVDIVILKASFDKASPDKISTEESSSKTVNPLEEEQSKTKNPEIKH